MVTGQDASKVDPKVVIALNSLAKMFIGEVVEKGAPPLPDALRVASWLCIWVWAWVWEAQGSWHGAGCRKDTAGQQQPGPRLLACPPSHPTQLRLPPFTPSCVYPPLAAARTIASDQGHHGALLPSHVRQAYQELSWEGRVSRRGPAKRLLR